MNLIMEASRKIGLDLGKYGGGQKMGVTMLKLVMVHNILIFKCNVPH
jgi:hypothetical protein